MSCNKPTFPFIPDGREILYVSLSNPFMLEAKKMADEMTACSFWPTGAVVVKNDIIIGRGANNGVLHPFCPRAEQNKPTGQGYDLCDLFCKQQGHSEITTINDALKNSNDPTGADLFLYGHWWCCEPCWNHMIKYGIKNVYLLENAHAIFTREKRQAVMDSIGTRFRAGENITLTDIIWN